MMFTTRDTKGHTKMCLTFIFKINHRGQVTDFAFFEILDLANVRIDTEIKFLACIQPEIRKVIQLICVTLSFKVKRQGHVIFLTYLISTTSKMLESTPRSTSYHVCNRRYERSCKKVFDLDFQGHAIKIEFFRYHRWIPWPRKHTHEKDFQKIRTGRQKSKGGVASTPLGRFRLAKYLGHLRVKVYGIVVIVVVLVLVSWFRNIIVE